MALVLDGYFDESERTEISEPLSVAGYIIKPTAYKAFCRDWKRMLESGPTPTTHFHMTNLYARDYEYKGWTADERADYLAEFVAQVVALAPPLTEEQVGRITSILANAPRGSETG